MTAEENKTVVMRYFEEAVDQANADLVDEMFTSDCIFHRGDYADPIKGVAAIKAIVLKVHEIYRGFKTTIYDMIGEDDLIACRLKHNAIHFCRDHNAIDDINFTYFGTTKKRR